MSNYLIVLEELKFPYPCGCEVFLTAFWSRCNYWAVEAVCGADLKIGSDPVDKSC